MKFFLYKIVNTINGKFYVGVTSNLEKGINNPNAKLTELDLLEIKKLLEIKLSSSKIAILFNASKATILRYKKIWCL